MWRGCVRVYTGLAVGCLLSLLTVGAHNPHHCPSHPPFYFHQPEEVFYTCAWTVDGRNGDPLLAIGGLRGIIKIIKTRTRRSQQPLG